MLNEQQTRLRHRSAGEVDDAATQRYFPSHAAETRAAPQQRVSICARRLAFGAALLVATALGACVLFGVVPAPSLSVARRSVSIPVSADEPSTQVAPIVAEPTQATPTPKVARQALAASPPDAARLLLRGEVENALAAYRALEAKRPGETVFAVLAERLEHAIRAHCGTARPAGPPCE